MLGNRTVFLSETGLMQSRKWLSSSYIMSSRAVTFLSRHKGKWILQSIAKCHFPYYAGKKLLAMSFF